MVLTTPKPRSVEEAKARLRLSVDTVDYLAPLRGRLLPVIALGLAGGFLTFYALKKNNIKMTTGLFELGVVAARKLL